MRMKDDPVKLDRDRAILAEYFEVLKRYGDLAKSIEKTKFYEEVADKFYLAPQTTAKIIRKQLKSSGSKKHHIRE